MSQTFCKQQDDFSDINVESEGEVDCKLKTSALEGIDSKPFIQISSKSAMSDSEASISPFLVCTLSTLEETPWLEVQIVALVFSTVLCSAETS